MALIDVTKSCLDSISLISEHIEGSVLYLDAGSTESFQLMGAFPLLLNHGVRAICSLESMSSLDAVVDWSANCYPDRKVVVVTSRLLSDAHRYILRCLSTHPSVRCCTIFTSISEIAHSAYPDSPLGPDAFHEYESLLVQDYEELVKKGEKEPTQPGGSNLKDNMNLGDEGLSHFSGEKDICHPSASARDSYEENLIVETEEVGNKLVVSVRHFPMILCPFSPRVFVLPSEGSIAEAYLSSEHEDALSPGLPSLSTGLLSDGDDTPPGATLTANFLYHFAAKMDLKLEIFSLGDLSKTVGKMLTDMSSLYDVGRRKKSAGLLLVDRTLDLLTPCCHGDSLVDRVFSSLPRRENTASHTHIKPSQSQLKQGPSYLERPSLNVQIPLTKILSKEDCKIDNFRLLDSIEAFLCGWDSGNSASQTLDLINLKNKIHNEKPPQLENEVLRGSFVSTESFRGTPYLEALLDRKTKDGTILVKKWLQEALRRENITVNVKSRPGFATMSELQVMTKALAKSQSSLLKHKGIIQLAMAALTALDESHSSRWEAFSSAEKILSVSAEDTSQSLAVQIGDFIHKNALLGLHGHKNGKLGGSQGVLSFQDALHLLITGYILAGEKFPTAGNNGPFSWQEEQLLKDSIVEATLENPSIAKLKFLHGLMEELETNLSRMRAEESKGASSEQIDIDDLDDDQWGKWGDDDDDVDDTVNSEGKVFDDRQLKLELRDRVDNLFKFLHKLSGLKSRSIPLKDGTLDSENNFGGDPYASKGLLYKLLTRILGKNDVTGLEYHSSTVGQLFKSGFRRFGLGQAKPNLADQNVIMIFVIGGINGVEVREAQEALAESGRPDIELIIGGTTLLTPNDMLELLLGKSSYL